ncbi:MAG: thermonuclease family protein [Patescibacteria group bacterium]|jgi:micrococcal nuclease
MKDKILKTIKYILIVFLVYFFLLFLFSKNFLSSILILLSLILLVPKTYYLISKKIKVNKKIRNILIPVFFILSLVLSDFGDSGANSNNVLNDALSQNQNIEINDDIVQNFNAVDSESFELKDNADLINSSSEIIQEEDDIKNRDLYKVYSVVDGDTIKLYIDNKLESIRMIGLDTPETVDPRKEVQCFGVEASNKAKEMLNGKNVILEKDESQGERDKYGRLLLYVYLEDGTLFNKWMIENGYGHEYTYNVPYKYQVEFQNAEKYARENKLGLWADNACVESASSDSINNDSQSNTNSQEPTISESVQMIEGPQVKKSSTGICHEKGTTYYERTKNFTPYDSIEECLNSGGRLPKV